MTIPPPELASLRLQITETDQEILRLLGERMRLVTRVGEIKAKDRLPSFDREREGLHLEDLVTKGASIGVPGELVRGVFFRLLAASRLVQRRMHQAASERFSIGVIGGTSGMGAFLARVFREGGFEVETMGLGEGATAKEVASRHDLVIVSVPIARTVEVIAEVAPHVRDGACLMDVTSLKKGPLEAMLTHAPAGVDVVATHPMFGPGGADFDRQKVVVCGGRGERGLARVRALFQDFGAEIVEVSAEDHDLQMALIQVLVHEKTMVLGSTLERLKADLGKSLHVASPIYRTELAMIGRMFSQSAELYADILTANPEAARLSHVFEQEAAHFARAVAMTDREAVIRRFTQIADYMKDFASWAKRQSDAILEDLVRHG